MSVAICAKMILGKNTIYACFKKDGVSEYSLRWKIPMTLLDPGSCPSADKNIQPIVALFIAAKPEDLEKIAAYGKNGGMNLGVFVSKKQI